MSRLVQKPSKTAGPLFSLAICRVNQHVVGAADGARERVRVAGRVLDGAGAPVPDALIEVWHPSMGFGRAATNPEGAFHFELNRPPYLNVTVFARGMLVHAFTRMYF